MNDLLTQKYNTSTPRYTSYPTAPHWNESHPNQEEWKALVKKQYDITNAKEGIALYVHLPYCESLCTYCGCNTRITVNHHVEIPYIDTVLKEWKMYLELFDTAPIIKDLHIGGGTPTFFSPKNLKLLIEGILKSSVIHPDAEFSFEGHPSNTNEEHLSVLFNLGFRRVSLGIQDFDPYIQDTINRFQTFEQVENVSALARKIGYKSINYDIIYGLPKQTLNSVQDTIGKIIRLKPDRIAYYSYAHVPWLKPGQRKFTENDLPEGEAKRKLYELGKGLLVEAGYKDIGMDHFSLPNESMYKAQHNNRLHRNFMGYTDKKTSLLLGLGASSISETSNAYMQNLKGVEAYQKSIFEKNFAINKGYILSTKDQTIKKLILELICNYSVKIDLQIYDVDEQIDIRKQLSIMEQEGILTINENQIKVTVLGKNYIRNISAVFDPRYSSLQQTKNIYSKSI